MPAIHDRFTLEHAMQMQVACSSSGLCPGTAALALTVVTAPGITLVNGTYLSTVVEVRQVRTHLNTLRAVLWYCDLHALIIGQVLTMCLVAITSSVS